MYICTGKHNETGGDIYIYIYIYVYDNKLKTCDYNLSDVDITTGGVSQSKRKTTTTTKQTKLSTFLLSFLLFFISFNRY